MRKRIKGLFSFMMIILPCITYSQVVNLIPPKHLDNDIAGVLNSWRTSGMSAFVFDLHVPYQIDVTESGYEISPNGVACGEEINSLIASLDNPPPSDLNMYMLYFPPGSYLIEESISLPGYVILKGAGGDAELSEQTHFHFDLSAGYAHPCISMSGEKNGLEDIYIIDETECSIEVLSFPTVISAQIPILNYDVIGATSMYTSVYGACSGNGVVKENKGKYTCSSIEPGDYKVATTFSNSSTTVTVKHDLHVSSKENSEISLEIGEPKQFHHQAPKNSPDSTKGSYPDDFYQNTIIITGSNNWLRGVESFHTRRFHVQITGDHNTVSGCYFHHSVDYSDNGGRGYGVCLSGLNTKFNRIEDNIFEHLRHAMVLQGDAKKNVFAYNYSREVHAFNGGFNYPADDLCLHGRVSSENGPKLNLLEGNYVIRSRVDKTHDYNGPFNTFFRNRAIDFFKIRNNVSWPESYREKQYAQNVIGCNMKPKGNTLSHLDEYGFRAYYTDYGSIPGNYCSYYLEDEPGFFLGWIQWPYTPWDDKIIPAKYRWDSHDPQWGYDEVPYAINQGWVDYDNLCAPPNYNFKDLTVEGESKEYLAMQQITLDNVEIAQDNELVFHAGESVLLKPGTKILNGNNHVIIKAGEVCGSKVANTSKYTVYSNVGKDENTDFGKTVKIEMKTNIGDNVIGNDIKIFPNPNNGRFTIKTDLPIGKKDIAIFGVLGNELHFDLLQENMGFKVDLQKSYKGVLFVRIKTKDIDMVSKLIIE